MLQSLSGCGGEPYLSSHCWAGLVRERRSESEVIGKGGPDRTFTLREAMSFSEAQNCRAYFFTQDGHGNLERLHELAKISEHQSKAFRR